MTNQYAWTIDRPTCGADNYRCSNDERHCIFHRFLCDGVPDCSNSEDESVSVCGPGDPCTGKVCLSLTIYDHV